MPCGIVRLAAERIRCRPLRSMHAFCVAGSTHLPATLNDRDTVDHTLGRCRLRCFRAGHVVVGWHADATSLSSPFVSGSGAPPQSSKVSNAS